MSFFQDPEFPPQVAMENVQGKYGWIPASCLLNGRSSPKRMPLFWRIEPCDMKQGSVGDCWLVAALSSLANFPLQVEALFENTAATADGKYVIRLHDSWGRVCRITVDEFVPTILASPNHHITGFEFLKHVPMFCKPNGEIWPLLVEKAMAKLLGSYAAMNGGNTIAAFRSLTGCTKQEMWKRESQASHWTSNLLAEGSMAMLYTRYWKMFPFAQFGSQLLQFSYLSFMMCASISRPDVGEHVRQDGLTENHSYSIIEIKGIEDFIMLRLRNPWGRGRWNGDWSDNSPTWDRFPAVAKALDFSPVGSHIASGSFWMEFSSFSQIFNEISVCHKSMENGPSRTQIGLWQQPESRVEPEKVQERCSITPTRCRKDQQTKAQERVQLQCSKCPKRKMRGRIRSTTPTKHDARPRSATPRSQPESCPQGHVLSPFATPEAGYACDSCRRLMPQDEQLYGCRHCNYDLCMECLPKRETRIHPRVGW